MNENSPLTADEILAARGLAQTVIARGKDVTDDTQTMSTFYAFEHLGCTYRCDVRLHPINVAVIDLFTDDWGVSMTLTGPSVRTTTDMYGRRFREAYRTEHLPFYDDLEEAFRIWRDGRSEAVEIIGVFWCLVFGKSPRGKVNLLAGGLHLSGVVNGSREAFERDFLMMKMDDNFPKAMFP